MQNEETAMIPFFAHESAVNRLERMNKRLWIVVLVLILFLAVSNGAWIAYESQFTDEVITVEQESETGYNNYIGNDGDITN